MLSKTENVGIVPCCIRMSSLYADCMEIVCIMICMYQVKSQLLSYLTNAVNVAASGPTIWKDLPMTFIIAEIKLANLSSRKYFPVTVACILFSHLNAILKYFFKLRNPTKYPIPHSRTKRYQSFLNHASAHYQK